MPLDQLALLTLRRCVKLCGNIKRLQGIDMDRKEHANRSDDAPALGECVSCSCCCPFRHAVRDDVSKQISIMCGNPARSNLGSPPKRK